MLSLKKLDQPIETGSVSMLLLPKIDLESIEIEKALKNRPTKQNFKSLLQEMRTSRREQTSRLSDIERSREHAKFHENLENLEYDDRNSKKPVNSARHNALMRFLNNHSSQGLVNKNLSDIKLRNAIGIKT